MDCDVLQRLIESSHRMAEMRSVSLLAHYAISEAVALVQAGNGYLALARDNGRIDVRAKHDVAGGAHNARRRAGESTLRQVIRTGQAVFSAEPSQPEQSTRPVVCVPLTVNDATIGAIYVVRPTLSPPFEETDVQSLTLFARQAAASLHNAMLNDRLARELETRKQDLQRLARRMKRALDRQTYLAQHDHLTGLPNRLLFEKRFEEAIDQAQASRRLTALLFLDLDNFKKVNDRLGHASGDRLLQLVARRLLDCCTGKRDTLARIGGDEFALIVGELRQSANAERIAGKILKEVARPFRLGRHEQSVTTSIGISLYPIDGTEATALLRKADKALYQSKDQGKNTYRRYPDTIRKRFANAPRARRESRRPSQTT